jgi:hypothetical protein
MGVFFPWRIPLLMDAERVGSNTAPRLPLGSSPVSIGDVDENTNWMMMYHGIND